MLKRRWLCHLLSGVAAMVCGLLAAAEPAGVVPEYPLTPPRVYHGKNLEAVAMPIGGIGTGTIWLDGAGRLQVWQIFNNFDESRVPDSFFAVRVQPAGGAPVVRVLETMPEQNLMPVPALTYEGGYPLARLNFTDPQLPVTICLEAFNPMIPLNTDDSSLPCAIFRWTARNSGTAPAKVTLLGTLRNAKGDRNRVVREGPLCAVSLDKTDDLAPTCQVKVRKALGVEVPGPQIQWLAQTPTLNCQATLPLDRIVEEGGAAVAGNIQPDFFNTLALLRSAAGKLPPDVAVFEDFERDDYVGWTITDTAFGKAPSIGTASVNGFAGRRLVNTYANGGDRPQGTARSKPFKIGKKYIGFLIGGGNNPNPLLPGDQNPPPVIFADFEKGDYTGWTITGTAFGKAPSIGTAPGQNSVSGFEGKFLINTFANGGDLPQGAATSMPFMLEKELICFLVGGGGGNPEQTCINLRVGDQVVRTATGSSRETLKRAVWDVSDLKGKKAVIEIVDKSSEGWGHINVDQILFTDIPVGETCFNLYADGRLVRSATGRNVEELQPVIWDVADLAGKESVLEIVDRNSGSWGHINVDQIVFADQSPETVMKLTRDANRLSQALTNLTCTGAEAATLPAPVKAALTGDGGALLPAAAGDWPVSSLTRLKGFSPAAGYRVLVATPAGEPLLIDGQLGKGRVLLALAPDLPWAWGTAWLAKMGGINLRAGERLTSGAPDWGSLVLAVLDDDGVALPCWNDAKTLTAFLDNPAAAVSPADEIIMAKPGEMLNAALAVPFSLAPGQSRTVTFAIAWHFPNVQRFEHAGNYYCVQWPDAAGVARYLAANLGRLWEQTRLYHDTVYQSNLPEEFLDAMTSQSVIMRGPTCFRSEDGYFGGYEGCNCCPLNCTHVWNYAQSHARLFPEVGRNMRVSDFITYLHPDGETSHRQYVPCGAFIDGHCASIEAALREYQLSADTKFLEQVWPGVKKAVDWMIAKFDSDHDGVTMGQQANTYDSNVSGANTFIGSQYLSALAAAERMALVMKDSDSAARWQTIREAGMKNQNERLWNGAYYFQIPEVPGASDYNNGCFADQLLGQWWAHQLNLGYLYPLERIKKAMETVMKENFRTTFAGFEQKSRRYIPDNEGGLLICTWPKNDRPKSFIPYADEVWTGIEYAMAGTMVCEGLWEPARKIVKMARSRYDGRLRPGLNSGPGGNPFNELECGKFYARAMSSWGLLITSQGLVLEGPKGILGFKPRWQPAEHRSFYTAPEGWGLFIQTRTGSRQTERIEVRYGRHRLHELVFELPEAASQANAELLVAGRPVKATMQRNGREVRLQLAALAEVSAGQTVEAMFTW